jgi:tetratricopeptide (TPR) repeat protein
MEIPRRFVDQLAKSVADRAIQNVEIIAVFRSDAEKAGALMKRHKWAFKAVALADTDWVPLARQYGLFATDRMPNAFVLGPEGDIMLALTGASPVAERHDQYVYQVENAIREYDLALAEQALAAGDYAAYAERLAVTFPLEGRQRDRYEPDSRAEILHRRQLIWAYVQLKDWQRALDAANASIAAHEKQERCRTCERRVMQLGERATLLKILGRDADAEKANALFMASICPAMLNAEGVAEKAVSEVERRLPKFGGSHERFLQDAEIRMAQEGQELHVFGLQHDLAMRAQALAGLGQVEAAATDRLRAAAFAWPHVVTEFHPYLLHEGFESRRKQARRALTKGEWQTALDLANANIDNHEAEAIRYDSRCEICGPQVRSFQLMADVLKDQLNKPDDAEAALAMAEEAICPKAEVSNTFMFFPMNRLYGGSGPGKSRYNFILGHMKGDGSCYPNQTHRKHRLEFAGDLFLRAQALEQLGRADEAQRDRKRASALTYPHGSAAAGGADELPARYVDVLSVKAE